jgi:exopolyphosphatase/guanosine-5'-triphosphate,3'-diphosphate pyrophosphatase
LIMDVGGGSTQFVFGAGGKRLYRQSFALGAVRLLETLPCSDPPRAEELAAARLWLRRFLQAEVRPRLAAAMEARRDKTAGTAQLVGVGGTASILGCMEAELTTFDRARLEATRLSAVRVSWHLERLWGLPLEQRKQIAGLPPNRADIILMGAAIYEAVMGECGFRELRISTRGLRFAALLPANPPAA